MILLSSILLTASVSLLDAGQTGTAPSRLIAMRPDSGVAAFIGGALTDSVQFFDVSAFPPVPLASYGHSTAPIDVLASPDGRYFVVRSGASLDGVCFYGATGAFLSSTPSATALNGFAAGNGLRAPRNIAVSPDSQWVGTLGGAGVDSFQHFNASALPPVLVCAYGMPAKPCDIDVLPNGKYFIVRGGAGPEGVLFFAPGACLPVTFPAATVGGDVVNCSGCVADRCIAITPDGTRTLVTGGAGTDSIILFDTSVSPPVVLARIGLATSPVDVAASPDSRFFAVRCCGAAPDSVTFFDAGSGAMFPFAASTGTNAILLGTGSFGNRIAISPDSARTAVIGGAGVDSIMVFDTSTLPPTPFTPIASATPTVDVVVTGSPGYFAIRAGAELAGTTFIRTASATVAASFAASTTTGGVYLGTGILGNNKLSVTLGGAYVAAIGGTALDAIQLFDATLDPPIQYAVFGQSTSQADVLPTPDGKMFAIRAGAAPDAVSFALSPPPSSLSVFAAATASGLVGPWGLTLRSTGPCPGPVSLAIEGGTPGGPVAVLYGLAGSFVWSGRQCFGIVLPIISPVLAAFLSANGAGNASLSFVAPPGACGRTVAAVDILSCEVSNPIVL